MKKNLTIRCGLTAVAILICLFMISCTKVNNANFEKVQEGMSIEEVVGILGEPTNNSEIDLSFVSGAAAKWVDEKTGRTIKVQFLNGKVKFKQFEDAKK